MHPHAGLLSTGAPKVVPTVPALCPRPPPAHHTLAPHTRGHRLLSLPGPAFCLWSTGSVRDGFGVPWCFTVTALLTLESGHRSGTDLGVLPKSHFKITTRS